MHLRPSLSIRTEALAQASALASQGKHAQARDFYVKAVDVTPQMAYQLIKVCCPPLRGPQDVCLLICRHAGSASRERVVRCRAI